jgi:hypothetical protein
MTAIVMPSTVGHLSALTERLPDGAGYVLSARTSTGKLGRAWDQLVTRNTIDSATQRCADLAVHTDVYVSCTATDADTFAETLSRGPGARGGRAAARWVTALWADIDVAGPGHAAESLPPTISAAEQVYADLPSPTFVIATGGGLHAWWLLDTAHPADGDLTDRWVRLVAAHAARVGWQIDAGVGDLARVLRVCGTYNRKTDTPRRVALHDVTRWPPGLADGAGWSPQPAHNVTLLRTLLPADLAKEKPNLSAPSATGQRPARPHDPRGPLNILDAVDAAPWSEIWPASWSFAGTETVDGVAVELWRRPDATSPHSAKCWPDGGCQVWSDQVAGLPAGPHGKAAVLAWREGLTLSELAREIIRQARTVR